MKTLSQHNNDTLAAKVAARKLAAKAGVQCDKCFTEMEYRDKIARHDAPKRVVCPNCNHWGWKEEE